MHVCAVCSFILFPSTYNIRIRLRHLFVVNNFPLQNIIILCSVRVLLYIIILHAVRTSGRDSISAAENITLAMLFKLVFQLRVSHCSYYNVIICVHNNLFFIKKNTFGNTFISKIHILYR